MKVRVVISGRSYDAADAVPDELSLSDGATVDDALEALTEHLARWVRIYNDELAHCAHGCLTPSEV